jgi:hypothetical protein
MNTLKFGAKVVIILVALMVLLCCGLTTLLTYQWLSPAARSVTEKVVTVPIAQDKEEVSKPSSNEEQASSVVSGSTENSERVCKFMEGYNADGRVVPAGTKVTGPAFVKPDRNTDWGLPVYLGESYTTTASDEVVWALDGDNACVDSQSAFFSFWGKTLTK